MLNIVCKGTGYPSNHMYPYGHADFRIGTLNAEMLKDAYPIELSI